MAISVGSMANRFYDGWLSKQAQAAHPIRAEHPGKMRSKKSPHLQFFGFSRRLISWKKLDFGSAPERGR
ncbi:hypothetical protein ACFXKI_45090 [Streptomyces mirabilis]|uniref:hypothetical protein n=1 Tax=Streptomyces mirabilis TaxID=68239 RepID=UPI0036B108EC